MFYIFMSIIISLNRSLGRLCLVCKAMFLCCIGNMYNHWSLYLNSVFKFSFQFNPSQNFFWPPLSHFLVWTFSWDITITNWKLFQIPLEPELRITSYGFKYQLLTTKFPSHPVYSLKGQELHGSSFFWNHSNHRLCEFLHLVCGEIFYFLKKREWKKVFFLIPYRETFPSLARCTSRCNHLLWFLITLEWIINLKNGTIKDIFRFLFSHVMWLSVQACS